MEFNRNKPYLVLNENPRYVNVPTKSGGIMLSPATEESPSQCQVYFDDIMLINGSSEVFKNGTLFFEKEYEAEIYEELRIPDWKNIWHNSDIERVLLNPTSDTLTRIVSITSRPAFERIRSVYVGMRNEGMDIPQKSRTTIEERQREFEQGILTTKITFAPVKKDESDKIAELERQMAELKAMVAPTPAPAPVAEEPVVEEPVAETKPVAKTAVQSTKPAAKRGRPKATTTKTK